MLLGEQPRADHGSLRLLVLIGPDFYSFNAHIANCGAGFVESSGVLGKEAYMDLR